MGVHGRIGLEWSKHNVASFVEIIYDKVKQNKLQSSTFTSPVWEEINREMILATNIDYGVYRLKGKWNRLRIRHRFLLALISHSGVTLDPNTGRVNASEKVWAEFYARNKKVYKAIRKEGCDHYHILGEIFGKSTTTSGMHIASALGPATLDDERALEQECPHAHVGTVGEESCEGGSDSSNQRRRSRESSSVHRRKEPRSARIDSIFEACLEQWSKRAARLSGESFARKKYLELKAAKLEKELSSGNAGSSEASNPYSLEACMDILNSMENLSDDSYIKATKAFQDPSSRVIFVKMLDSRRMAWLDRI